MTSKLTLQRTDRVLTLLESLGPGMFGGVTNREIGEVLGISYRAVQKITQRLSNERLISGRVNQWGKYSNVSWRISPPQGWWDQRAKEISAVFQKASA